MSENRSTRSSMRMVVIIGLLATSATATASAQVAWTDERIASLFPPLPDRGRANWLEAGPVKVETPAAAPAILLPDGAIASYSAAPPARIRAEREYRTARGAVAMAIDTEDLEMAGVVLSVNGLMVGPDDELVPADPDAMRLRDQFLSQGLRPLTLPTGHVGFFAPTTPGGNSLLAFRSGRAGVVSVTCAYARCADDLSALLAELDWTDVDSFTAYDHRRPATRDPR